MEDIGGSACFDHIVDTCLADRLKGFVSESSCDMCGRDGASELDAPFAFPLEQLLEVVVETLEHLYMDASILPWDSEDREYIGPRVSTSEAIWDIAGHAFDGQSCDSIIEMLSTAVGNECDWTSWYADGGVDGLEFAWEQFADTAMHRSRLVIGLGMPDDPPMKLGRFLKSLLLYAEENLGLVKRLPAGTPLYRGRPCENPSEIKAHSTDLGPAPPDKATANRMSPAGISLFYASEDPQTAIAEIAVHSVAPTVVLGSFSTTRELRILDLTSPPNVISPFCLEQRKHGRMGRFLASFVQYITAPVIPDGRQHVEYAPTQLLTEYLRWVPTPKLDGIALPSAQTKQRTYVLFFGQDDCGTLGQIESEAPGGHFLGALDGPALVLDPDAVVTYQIQREFKGVAVKSTG